jgi:hypothetical protein
MSSSLPNGRKVVANQSRKESIAQAHGVTPGVREMLLSAMHSTRLLPSFFKILLFAVVEI